MTKTIALSVVVPPECAQQRRGEPLTLGLPMPKGLVHHTDSFLLSHVDGAPLASQTRVLDRWSDGSVRWALLDFQGDVHAGHSPMYRLGHDALARPPAAASIDITDTTDAIVIATHAATFTVARSGSTLLRDVVTDPMSASRSYAAVLRAETADGATATLQITGAHVEEPGPLRSVVTVTGTIGRGRRRPLLDVTVRLHFFSGLSTVRFDVTIRNSRAAAHPGGYWDLGGRSSVFLKDLSVELQMPADSGPCRIECSPEVGSPFETAADSLEVYQDSSGGANWTSSNHVNRQGEVPIRMRGYRLRAGRSERTGLRATPIVAVTATDRRLAATVPEFWQNFPKAIEAARNGITVRLFPKQWNDLHEIQGGEQKTHTLFANFGTEDVTATPLTWAREPLLARAEPEWYCASSAVPYLTSCQGAAHRDYLRLVDAAIDGADTFERKREVIDEYGWRNFGDIYADHEAVGHTGPTPLVSHFNNQYDAVRGFICHFLRTGDVRWWRAMHELARHVVDIDLYHTTGDKSAYNHGMFWHTAHYQDARTATHRCYSRAGRSSGVMGGGPSAEHNYTTGLMLHYFLTGHAASRDAVLELAQFVVDIDDGNRTPLRWLTRARTGLATASRSFLYHGPGRGSGNSLNALIDGHRLSGNPLFLHKAEEIIRRVVHPDDDVSAHDLLDAEQKWSYTVFLQSLGKYLDHKTERDERDDMYWYARASLLHYARWMAVHERPYLDTPERLEFPNETWAAQDMRKSEVFDLATQYGGDAERLRFQERAEFFFHYSIAALSGMPTRTLARPVVLMLSYGFARAYFAQQPVARTEQAERRVRDFGRPAVFVPQKMLAKQRVFPAQFRFFSDRRL